MAPHKKRTLVAAVGVVALQVCCLGYFAPSLLGLASESSPPPPTPTPTQRTTQTTSPPRHSTPPPSNTTHVVVTPDCAEVDPFWRKGPSKVEEAVPCRFVLGSAVHSKDAVSGGSPQRHCGNVVPSQEHGSADRAASQRRAVHNALSSGDEPKAQSLLANICAWDTASDWDAPPAVHRLLKDALSCTMPDPPPPPPVIDILEETYPFYDNLHHKIAVSEQKKLNTIGNSVYYRERKGSWVSLKNVCVSCDVHREAWMDHRRPCHTTVWGVGKEIKELASRHRKGRPSIYKEQQAAFQYGGTTGKGEWGVFTATPDTEVVSWYAGTAVYLAAFSNPNVGHALHDALFAFLSVASSLDAISTSLVDLPSPYRIIIEPDFFRNSIRFYSTFAMLFATTLKPPIEVFLHNQHSHSCFESIIFTGGDREMKGVSVSGRGTTTERFRRAVYTALNTLGRPSGAIATLIGGVVSKPRVFLYARHEVHRRSLVNFGDLYVGVADVLRGEGLPAPTIITTMTLHPLQQAELFAQIDILVTVQGAHMQNSIFMPPTGGVIELSPCRARKTSFLHRYGKMLPKQNHVQLEVCFPSVNLGKDKYAQNLTLCSHHIGSVAKLLLQELARLKRGN